MSYRKSGYRDLEKWKKTVTEHNRKYYRKTAIYPRRPWTDEEIEKIISREKSDRELSVDLKRSMKSIIVKRSKIKKQMEQEAKNERNNKII